MKVIKVKEGCTTIMRYSILEKECEKRFKKTKGNLKEFYRNARNGFQLKIGKEFSK